MTATLVSIAVTPNAVRTGFGTTVALTAIGTYSDTTTQDLTSTAAWTTTKAVVATVGATGVVHALAPGEVTITATVTSISGTADVKVHDYDTYKAQQMRALLPPPWNDTASSMTSKVLMVIGYDINDVGGIIED